MSEFLFQYHKVHAATWAYLSSLLAIALFFVFSRVWRVRNLDLVLLILLAPGLLMVTYGREEQQKAAFLLDQVAKAATLAAPETPTPAPPSAKTEEPTAPGAAVTAPRVEEPGTAPPADDGSDSADEAPSDTDRDDDPPQAAVPAPPVVAGEGTNDARAETPSNATDPPSGDAAERTRIDELTAKANETMEIGRKSEKQGYYFLLAMCGVLLIRLLLDPTMVRRPLLEPNLATGGMVFMGCALFIFLMANVITSETTADDMRGAMSAQRLLARSTDSTQIAADSSNLERHGPGYALLSLLPSISTVTILQPQATDDSPATAYEIAAKVMAILSHLAVVLGMIGIGYWHFENVRMGVGAALLYLLFPYTSLMTGRVDHVLPAALLVWAVLCYRRPLAAGIFIGLAAGVVYYPLFLLPLWFSFYRQRGVWRFATGLLLTLLVMTASLTLISDSWQTFGQHVRAMFGLWLPKRVGMDGVWGVSWDPVYRLPVLGAFIVLSFTLAIWPARKNLGTLLSCSAALMVATQFWHGYGGGLYMGWFLPLTLLTVFRPNLEDRVALSVLNDSWLARRRPSLARVGEAA